MFFLFTLGKIAFKQIYKRVYAEMKFLQFIVGMTV